MLNALPEEDEDEDRGMYFNKKSLNRMLVRLGVKHLIAQDVIEQHILPILTNNDLRMTKPKSVLAAYICYIKEQILTPEYLSSGKLPSWQNQLLDQLSKLPIISCYTIKRW